LRKLGLLILSSVLMIAMVVGCGGDTKPVEPPLKKVLDTIKLYNNDPEMEGQSVTTKYWSEIYKWDYLRVGHYYSESGFLWWKSYTHYSMRSEFTFPLKELKEKNILPEDIKSVKVFFHRKQTEKTPDILGDLVICSISFTKFDSAIFKIPDSTFKKLDVYGQPGNTCWFYTDYTTELKETLKNQEYIQMRMAHSNEHDVNYACYEYIHHSLADQAFKPYILVEYYHYK